jgi:hypothetical protein
MLIALLLVVACSKSETPAVTKTAPPPPPAPPTKEQARELVAGSADFGEFEFTNAAVTLPMKKPAMNEPAQQLAKDLRAGGWIGFSGDDVVLTPKAKGDKRFLVRPNGFVDVVPLAKKEFGEVVAVRGEDVDFTWKWIRNDIGAAIHKPDDAIQRATATLIHDGTSWSVLRIRPSA